MLKDAPYGVAIEGSVRLNTRNLDVWRGSRHQSCNNDDVITRMGWSGRQYGPTSKRPLTTGINIRLIKAPLAVGFDLGGLMAVLLV